MMRLFVQVGKICPEGAGEDELIVSNGVTRFQVAAVHSAPFADGAGFLGQFQIGDAVVTCECVIDLHNQSSITPADRKLCRCSDRFCS